MTASEMIALLDGQWPAEDVATARDLGNGRIAWVSRFVFTSAILISDETHIPCGYYDRFCYHTFADAQRSLDAWKPESEAEPEGWHRHPPSGRRREEGDAAREHVNF